MIDSKITCLCVRVHNKIYPHNYFITYRISPGIFLLLSGIIYWYEYLLMLQWSNMFWKLSKNTFNINKIYLLSSWWYSFFYSLPFIFRNSYWVCGIFISSFFFLILRLSPFFLISKALVRLLETALYSRSFNVEGNC